ncbi:hypothetical protein [Streptomyces sp. TLI_171]|uniref:hypothetical protein n=1 Tax=Streptomyces sp. TLI_171 TaxID=1938859 RepID=UPI0011C44612|nr:hypothetical protein [Streptomyces sp. TLI_171]
MPQITWGRRAPLSVESVGHALLVRLPGQQARQARAFAAGLLADPEHRIVVLDLPAGSGPSDCRAAAHLLARVPGPMRLVFGRPPAGDTLSIGTWFSRRLARTVVLADGPLEAGRGGSLFVRPGTGAGWVRFTPDTDPEHIALRHPRPGWEPLLHERTWRVGRSTTVEPLPAGVWLHGPGDEDSYAAHRSRLVADLQLHPDLLPVVVGAPGTAPPPLDEVARYVDSLRAAVRPALRFFGFGPAGRVSEPLGQALADVLQRPVDCFAGLPTGDWHRRECRLIDADGVATWQSYAHELRFLPRAAAGDPAPAPVVLSHRAPLPGLTEVGPGVYSLAPDAVVEVVQSGLWVRGSEDPPGAAAVRRLPPDPERASVLHSLLPGPCERRFRELAHKVLLGLDDETRALSLLVPAPADAVPARYGLALGSTWASQALPVASTEAVRPAGRTAGEAMGRGPEPAPAPQTGAAEALWGIDGTPAHGTAVLGTPVAEPTVYAASVESEASLPASAGIPAAELVGGPVPVLPTAPAEPASSVLGTEKAAPEAATAPPVPPPSAAAAPDLVTSSLLLSGDYALFGVAPEPEENPPYPSPRWNPMRRWRLPRSRHPRPNRPRGTSHRPGLGRPPPRRHPGCSTRPDWPRSRCRRPRLRRRSSPAAPNRTATNCERPSARRSTPPTARSARSCPRSPVCVESVPMPTASAGPTWTLPQPAST